MIYLTTFFSRIGYNFVIVPELKIVEILFKTRISLSILLKDTNVRIIKEISTHNNKLKVSDPTIMLLTFDISNVDYLI